MSSYVNILIAGDDNAGKTSLINTFISGTFSDEVTAGNLEVKIPHESVLYRKHVNILDSHENPVQLDLQLRKTDCVVILADCSRPASLNAVASYWLPLVRDVFASAASASPAPDTGDKPATQNRTAIVALSKADLLPAEEVDALLDSDRWGPVFREFPFVACITSCSAKALSVKAVIDMAARLGSYPLWPLYDIEKQQCRPEMWRAFKRIFRIHDRDLDGLLSDSELNSFQKNCDWDIIKREELLAIKRKIQHTFSKHGHNDSSSCNGDAAVAHRGAFSSAVPVRDMIRLQHDSEDPGRSRGQANSPLSGDFEKRSTGFGSVGLINDRITFDGFFSLIVEVTCRDLNLALPWTALEIFNYNDELELELPAVVTAPPVIRPNHSITLSPTAVDFLFALVTNSHAIASASDYGEFPAEKSANASSDSESEYLRKVVGAVSSLTHSDRVPPFLAEPLCVLPSSIAHPWRVIDPSPSPMASPLTPGRSPGTKEPRLNKANLQRAVSTGGNGSRAVSAPSVTAKSEGRRSDAAASKQKAAAAGLKIKKIDETPQLPPFLFASSPEQPCTYLGCMRDRNSRKVLTSDIHSLAVHWLTQWHSLAMHDPVLVKTLLFRLGYVSNDRGLCAVPSNVRQRCAAAAQVKSRGVSRVARGHASSYSTFINVSILGCGELDAYKYGLMVTISDANITQESTSGRKADAGNLAGGDGVSCDVDISSGTDAVDLAESAGSLGAYPDVSLGADKIVSGGCHVFASDLSGSCQTYWKKPRGTHTMSPFASISSAFVVTTAVPAAQQDAWLQGAAKPCADIAVILFAHGDSKSFEAALDIEKKLPGAMPRLFVEVETDRPASSATCELVRSGAATHTTTEGIYVPIRLTAASPMGYSLGDVKGLVEQCVRVAVDAEERGVPVQHRGKHYSFLWGYLGKGFGTLALVSFSAYVYVQRPVAVIDGWESFCSQYAGPMMLQFSRLFAAGAARVQSTFRSLTGVSVNSALSARPQLND